MIDLIRTKKKGALNPLSLIGGGLILYLNSTLGTSGFADGANVTPTWPDQSGNAYNAGSVVPAVMRRSGGSTSLNGSPTISFTGTDSPNGSYYSGSTPAPWPATTNGRHYLFYGRFAAAINTAHQSEIWTDGSGARPSLLYEQGASKLYAFIDSVGTFAGNAFAAAYGLLEFLFNPPNDGTGIAEAYMNGVSKGINHAWSFNNALTSGYFLGANGVGNVPCLMDLCAVVIASRILTAVERSRMTAYFVQQFG